MAKASPPEAARKLAWAKTRSAVRAYARNPSAATERCVAAAVQEIRQRTAMEVRRSAMAKARPGPDSAGEPRSG